MTTIGALSNTGTADPTASGGLNKPTLDYDAFLKLLVAQMQNQDPMNPMESSEYVAQLASFSNVEQGLKMNTKLDQLLVLSNLAQANNIVGMNVTSADGTVSGVVTSVKIADAGAIAFLSNGKQVKIESGITLSAA